MNISLAGLKMFYVSYDGAQEPIPQSQVLPYLRQFVRQGVVVHWLSFDKKSSFACQDEKSVFKGKLAQEGIRWYSLAYHKKPSVMAKIYDMVAGMLYGVLILLRERIDIIHGRSEVASIIAIFFKLTFRKKFIYDRRGFMAEDYIEGGMWKNRESLVYKIAIFIDRILLLESKWIVVLTYKMKDILIMTFPAVKDKITVIPCCVDLKRFTCKSDSTAARYSRPDDRIKFLYSGSIGTWYMLEEMLVFFSLAKEVIPGAHFMILTLGDLNVVKNKITQKRLALDDFTLIGVPPQRIHEYIPLADIALVFIKPVFSKLASSPTKFAEDLACGLPVIINTGIGDTQEIIEKERVGVIVKGFNESSYRQALGEAMNLLAEGPAVRKRCRVVAENYFSLEDGAGRYLNIYKKFRAKN